MKVYILNEKNGDVMQEVLSTNSIPQIGCSVVIIFEDSNDIDLFIQKLNKIGITEFSINKPKCTHTVEISIAKIKNECSWELDQVLNKMFSKIEDSMKELRDSIDQFNATTCIDIVFYQFGTYPALTISEKNIKNIHYLNASVSIDPY